MWSRAELKTKAKSNFFKNYWKVVVVTLILGLVSGTMFGGSYNFASNQERAFDFADNVNDNIEEYSDESFLATVTNGERLANRIYNYMNSIPWETVLFILVVAALVLFASILLTIFVLNPIRVGCMKWYIKNREYNPDMGMIVDPFRERYGNTIKIMFLMGLYTFLWSLLFVIPGIIKSYEYRMIPYILAENPDISAKDAFAMTKQMMTGDKWNTFILDWSFVLWNMLSALACGILSIFFVQPYIELTNIELYIKLKEIKLGIKDAKEPDFTSNPYGNGGNQDMNNDGYTEI